MEYYLWQVHNVVQDIDKAEAEVAKDEAKLAGLETTLGKSEGEVSCAPCAFAAKGVHGSVSLLQTNIALPVSPSQCSSRALPVPMQVKKRKAAQAGLQKERMLLEKKIKKKRADADSAVRSLPLHHHRFRVSRISPVSLVVAPQTVHERVFRAGAESGHGQDAGGDSPPVAEAEDGGGGAGHQAVAGAAAGGERREATGAAP